MAIGAFIAGLKGPELSRKERSFFRDSNPWGFILFRRNIVDPDQVSALTASLRDCVGRSAPILVDQEGGRVQRLGPPHWLAYPPGRTYGSLRLNEPPARRELARLGARLMAHDLKKVGIDVDCLPVLDVPVPGAHDIIGDRAYADNPDDVAIYGRAAAEGLLAGGVLPVIKHIPGHGRAFSDSHEALPVVDAPRAELEARDFAPFRMLADMPLAMTAHVVYTAIDAKAPATTSKKVISKIIRGSIGYGGLVMSDDLSMKALSGSLTKRAEAAIEAGCDVALHCNGELDEMIAVAKGVPSLRGRARRRADAALARILKVPEPLDLVEGRARFAAALAAGA